jgi:catechol 2,3-dioxygenase-like lactoylglutathione lyase family enzyme
VALQVEDPQRSKDFYIRVLKMQLEWEPDADNVYLTNQGQDNLALHRRDPGSLAPAQRLDHIGFMVPEMKDVDAWHAHIRAEKCKIVRELKTHRDGARSFYFEDPDGIIIQMIFHPPVSESAKRS